MKRGIRESFSEWDLVDFHLNYREVLVSACQGGDLRFGRGGRLSQDLKEDVWGFIGLVSEVSGAMADREPVAFFVEWRLFGWEIVLEAEGGAPILVTENGILRFLNRELKLLVETEEERLSVFLRTAFRLPRHASEAAAYPVLWSVVQDDSGALFVAQSMEIACCPAISTASIE